MTEKIDRIDFRKVGNKTIVNKLVRRDGRAIVIEDSIKIDFDLNKALTWCEANGWTVRRWDGGARAFFGKPWVIRTRSQIIKARERFAGEGKVHMDFAYDG